METTFLTIFKTNFKNIFILKNIKDFGGFKDE